MAALRDFESVLEEAARFGPKRISVAVAQDEEVLKGIMESERRGLASGVLFGDGDKIEALARKMGMDLGTCEVVHEKDPIKATRGATELVSSGGADILMKGKVNTADLIRILVDREMGLRTGRLLGVVVAFEVPGFDRLMLLTDTSINIAPDLMQKAELCRNAIELAHALGIEEPKLAALAAFEFVNPEMPATVDAANLTLMNRRGQIAGGIIDGPIALDAPLSAEAARQKGLVSPVVGEADIFLAPDIEAANIMLRCIIYLARGKVGGVVVGAKVPVVLLSRAEPAETKLHSIALAVLLSKAKLA